MSNAFEQGNLVPVQAAFADHDGAAAAVPVGETPVKVKASRRR